MRQVLHRGRAPSHCVHVSDYDRNMQQAYCSTGFLAAKEARTFDLRFRHRRHAASVCLRFGLEDWFGPGVRFCDVVVDSADEPEVVVAVGDDDKEDDNEDPCEN